MTQRNVLITGSAGHLGRALRAAFEAQGDVVTGVDTHNAEFLCDLESMTPVGNIYKHFPTDKFDIVVCNAKLKSWISHNRLAGFATSSIINIASIYGALGPDPMMYYGTEIEQTPAWYAASKGAMIALTKHQATTLAPVRSNAIILGGIFRDHSDVFRERYEAKVPLCRMATEQDAVDLCLFLASDKAAYITGACIPCDGGLSAMA
jgi:NAD(P)-dependent dehydrogenase (short-subunit alcohol dehydrogenase family)